MRQRPRATTIENRGAGALAGRRDPKSRGYLVAMATAALLVLLIFGSFNYAIDPLQFYRKATLYPPRFSTEQRFQNPGLARNYEYDTVVIGTSMTENFYPRDVEARLGGKTLNLSISGATAHEQAMILDVALRSRAPESVIWGLDWFAFATPHDAVRRDFGPFPRYLYGSGLRAIRGYLLNWDTFQLSLDAIRSRAPTAELESLNTWDTQRRQGCEEVVSSFHDPEVLRNNVAAMKRRVADADAMRTTLDESLFRLAARHPDTVFYAYFPPYSIAHHVYFRAHFPREYAALEMMRRLVSERAGEFPNLRIFDFQTVEDWTHDFSEYVDMSHHSRTVNGYILDALASGSFRADPREGIVDLRSQVARFTAPMSTDVCGGPA